MQLTLIPSLKKKHDCMFLSLTWHKMNYNPAEAVGVCCFNPALNSPISSQRDLEARRCGHNLIFNQNSPFPTSEEPLSTFLGPQRSLGSRMARWKRSLLIVRLSSFHPPGSGEAGAGQRPSLSAHSCPLVCSVWGADNSHRADCVLISWSAGPEHTQASL